MYDEVGAKCLVVESFSRLVVEVMVADYRLPITDYRIPVTKPSYIRTLKTFYAYEEELC